MRRVTRSMVDPRRLPSTNSPQPFNAPRADDQPDEACAASSLPDPSSSPLRSVHTDSFAAVLRELGVSLVVSTYQAGFLILLRAQQDKLNTHFRRFSRPMGLAASASQVALGTSREVIRFYNMPALAEKLTPAGAHDACYLPRHCHFTGDIDIHEMAFGSDALWFVNTRFSCLCTIDDDHSFVPRWHPRFITALSPDDRCHLNGVAIDGGAPRYATALAATNSANGWREHKARGGVLIDIPSGDVLVEGLSMPHSPRWYAGRLWMLESGDGTLGVVDLSRGRYEPVARLPGFTRGLSFCGPFAFVGLSQVRESAVFSGIPLTEQQGERACGVSVIHLPTGREVGFVHFEDAVHEVFAVEVVPHRFPDLLEPDDARVANSYAIPDAWLTHVEPPSGAEPHSSNRPAAADQHAADAPPPADARAAAPAGCVLF